MTATEIVARNRAALDARDPDAFAQFYAADAEIVGPGGRVIRGEAGARRLFETRLGRLSNLEFTVETESVDGSVVTVEGNVYGRIPRHVVAASREHELVARFIETFVVEDGLIRAHKLFLDQKYRSAPWETGRPQSAIVQLAHDGYLSGRVLDVGCGTGDNALFLAGLARDVVGIDASKLAIEKASTKARQRGLAVDFVCGDATALPFSDQSFDSVLDCGLLHVLQEQDYERFIRGLHRVLRTDGSYHVLCLNEHAALAGPRRLTKAELQSIFARDWVVGSIEETTFDVNLDVRAPTDASAWLARMRHG
jgi:SAM-dependent methyltransferase/ketosteroid isomerase-like protein